MMICSKFEIILDSNCENKEENITNGNNPFSPRAGSQVKLFFGICPTRIGHLAIYAFFNETMAH